MPVWKRPHRKRVVDLGRRRIVDRERPQRSARQPGHRRRVMRRERGALRKRLKQEPIEVVIMRRWDRAAGGQQRDRVRLQRRARSIQGARFDRELVGLVEQHRQDRAKRFRQVMLFELPDIRGDLSGLAAFAFCSCESGLQRIGRCRSVAALPLLVEMHRRAVQAERERCGFRGFGRSPEVLAGEVGKAEFALAAHFPQEIRIEPGGKRPRIREQRRRRRFA